MPCRVLFGGTVQLNSYPQRRIGEGDLNYEDDLRTRDELKNYETYNRSERKQFICKK